VLISDSAKSTSVVIFEEISGYFDYRKNNASGIKKKSWCKKLKGVLSTRLDCFPCGNRGEKIRNFERVRNVKWQH
jgi:hypothetical protein